MQVSTGLLFSVKSIFGIKGSALITHHTQPISQKHLKLSAWKP